MPINQSINQMLRRKKLDKDMRRLLLPDVASCAALVLAAVLRVDSSDEADVLAAVVGNERRDAARCARQDARIDSTRADSAEGVGLVDPSEGCAASVPSGDAAVFLLESITLWPEEDLFTRGIALISSI